LRLEITSQKRAVIETAMLHHVTENRQAETGPLADYVVTPRQLESYLLRRAEWRAVSSPKQEEAEEKCLIVTFDDGYRNNLTEALPVLEKHEVPCILFITTGFIDGTIYPYELELAEVIEHADTLVVPGRTDPVDLQSSDRRSVYRELRLPLKPQSHTRREAFMNQLASKNRYDRKDMQSEPILDWDEVRTLNAHPLVTIGAHSRSHVLLSRQTWWAAWREIRDSKERLEQKIGESIAHFSYPYGGNNMAVRQMARWMGVRYGFTTQARRAHRVTAWNRLTLPRIDINDFVSSDG
jgi:peptidoglycan/xylan/chitin deacetylase (PgdA/CDA1 family)